jgi:hypothetical protein
LAFAFAFAFAFASCELRWLRCLRNPPLVHCRLQSGAEQALPDQRQNGKTKDRANIVKTLYNFYVPWLKPNSKLRL